MIIFGLGNPGLRYRATRHNAGAVFLKAFAKQKNVRFRKYQGFRTAKLKIAGYNITLVKLQCFMNNSGGAVAYVLGKKPDDFLIILDDINLPLGKLRLRKSGSDGGHLGLRSIVNTMDSSSFPRLRIGVGRSGEDVARYVLSPFSRAERKLLRRVIDEGIKGMETMFRDGFAKAQNDINAIDLEIKPEARNPKP
jgi:PTH1 family peptidyl-tRNA hydrolase